MAVTRTPIWIRFFDQIQCLKIQVLSKGISDQTPSPKNVGFFSNSKIQSIQLWLRACLSAQGFLQMFPASQPASGIPDEETFDPIAASALSFDWDSLSVPSSQVSSVILYIEPIGLSKQGTDLIDLLRLLERVDFWYGLFWQPRRLLWPPNSLGGQIWHQIWNQWPQLPTYPCAYCLYVFDPFWGLFGGLRGHKMGPKHISNMHMDM